MAIFVEKKTTPSGAVFDVSIQGDDATRNSGLSISQSVPNVSEQKTLLRIRIGISNVGLDPLADSRTSVFE